MRSGARATIGVVAEGVNVHATLSVGIVAAHIPGDGRLGVLGCLLEVHGTLDVGVSTDNSDWEAC